MAAVRTGQLGGRAASTLIYYLLWHGRAGEAAEALRILSSRPGDQAGLPPPDLALTTPGAQAADLAAVRLWLDYFYPGLGAAARRAGPGVPPQPPGPARMPADLKGATMLPRALLGDGEPDLITSAEQILQGCSLDDLTLPPITAALLGLLCADRIDRAASWCQLLLAQARTRAVPAWQAVLTAIRAMAGYRQGDLAAARSDAAAALSLLSPPGWGVPIGAPLAVGLLTCAASGRPEEAARYLRVPVPPAMFQTPYGLMYLRARGRHHLSAGRPHAALADFQSCADRMAAWGLDVPAFLPWRTEAAQAYLRMGRSAEAAALAREQLARLGPRQHQARGVTKHVLALTCPLQQRPALLLEAVGLLASSGDRLELAAAFADLSRSHLRLGEHSQALVAASRAQSLAEQCGAQPLLDELPGRPGCGTRRRGGPGDAAGPLAGLSKAERRVAVLASRGYTNRQIAGQLYITTSTVEQHLTRVYRKLHVRSRVDLPAGLPAG